MIRTLVVLLVLLVTIAVAGCAASTNRPRDAWDYTGTDPDLVRPSTRPMPGETPENLQRRGQESFAAWKLRVTTARDAARSACAKETGLGEDPGIWSGYDPKFLDCMRSREWKNAHGGNPL